MSNMSNASSRSSALRWAVLSCHVFLMIFYLAFLWVDRTPKGLESQLIPALSVAATLLCVWMLWSWGLMTGRFFDPYVVFLLSAMAFNAGRLPLELMGLNEGGLLDGVFSPRTTINTIILVTFGLASFHLGGLASVMFCQSKRNPAPDDRRWSHGNAMRTVGWMLLIFALPFWLVTMAGDVQAVLAGGYIALYQQGADGGSAIRILSNFLLPGAFFVLLGSQGRLMSIVFSILVICVYASINIFLGYRAYAMWPVIAMIWAIHTSIRRIPTSVLAFGALITFFVILPLIGATRSIEGEQRLSMQFLTDSYLSIDNPLIDTVSEMGGSMSTVAHTLELVPSFRDFDRGLSYLLGFTVVIPNFFGDLHPAVARGTASDWLVRIVDPWNAERGGGMGFSFIAEAYMNFGWIGAPIALAVVGALFAFYFDWATTSHSPLKIAGAAIALSFLALYARGETYAIIRPLVWYALVPCVVVLGLTRLAGVRAGVSGASAEEQQEKLSGYTRKYS